MADENEDRGDLVLRLLREMREDINTLRVDTAQGFREVRYDLSRIDGRLNRLSVDVRELSLQTALLETRMTKVMDFIDQHDQRLAALEAR